MHQPPFRLLILAAALAMGLVACKQATPPPADTAAPPAATRAPTVPPAISLPVAFVTASAPFATAENVVPRALAAAFCVSIALVLACSAFSVLMTAARAWLSSCRYFCAWALFFP